MKKISEEQEYNRSLEGRIGKWMEETSDRVKKMDDWQKSFAFCGTHSSNELSFRRKS